MKPRLPDRIARGLLCGFILACAALGNAFCFIRFFDITADPESLLVWVLSAALLFALAGMTSKPGWAAAGCIALFAAALFLGRHTLVLEWKAVHDCLLHSRLIRSLLGRIGLGVAYGIGPLDASGFMAAVGILFGIGAALVWLRKLPVFIPAAANLALITFLTILRETPTPAWGLFLLFCAHTPMLLGRLLRTRSFARSERIAAALLVPLAAAGCLCVVLSEWIPRPTWVPQLREKIVLAWESVDWDALTRPFRRKEADPDATLGSAAWNDSAAVSALGQRGSAGSGDGRVMSIYSDRDRTLYLRGASYAVYENNRWVQLDEEQTRLLYPMEEFFLTKNPPTDELLVRLTGPSSVFYLPYTAYVLPTGAAISGDSFVENPERVLEYRVLYFPGNSFEYAPWDYQLFVRNNYLGVPQETALAIQPIVDELNRVIREETERERKSLAENLNRRNEENGQPSLSDSQFYNLYNSLLPGICVRVVADYVRNCAEYDLATPAVPNGKDFVPWFLNECDTGICVHFASSAVLLLRSLGVPARYVTGYRVEAQGGRWNTVTQEQAHAWVEYYDTTQEHWTMLEVTASISPETDVAHSPLEPVGPVAEPQADEDEEIEEEDETEPATPIAPVAEPEPGESRSRPWVLPAVGITALLLFLILWPVMIRAIRKRWLSPGDPDLAARRIWRHMERLRRLGRLPASERMTQIAWKARFSQHAVTPEELDEMRSGLEAAREELKAKMPVLLRLLAWYALGL